MAVEKEALRLRTLADGSVMVEGERGAARLGRVAPGVVLYDCSGVLSASFYEPMLAVAATELAGVGSLVMFVDGWDLRSVDTGFREQWTEWFKAHKQEFHMRLLVRSKLMDMAASLANLFTGVSVIKSYSSVATWEDACRSDHPPFRRSVKATGS